MEVREEEIGIGGLQMRWQEAGEGIPLVLIHGIPTSPALWRYVIPQLRGARCLAWEMVGYGYSIPAGRDQDISVGRQADHLMDWLDALDIRQAVLAGHDLGGGVAHIAAVRHPDRCLGLFLTNAIGYDSWPIPSVKTMRAAGALLRHLPSPLMKQNLKALFYRGHDDSSMAREALDLHWRPYAQSDGAAALIRQVRSLDVEDTQEVAGELKKLDLPARIVWGADDQFQKLAYGEAFARDLHAPLERIPAGKHFTPEDHPEIIAAQINLLLGEVRPRLTPVH